VTLIVARRPPQVTVPSVGGASLADATSQLRALGLRVSSREQPVSVPTQDGTVINQDPAPGTDVDRGSRVRLVVGRFEESGDGGDGDRGGPPDDGGGPQPGQDDGFPNGQGPGDGGPPTPGQGGPG
jgi:beta-lactam-binding protein with PASTA domain